MIANTIPMLAITVTVMNRTNEILLYSSIMMIESTGGLPPAKIKIMEIFEDS